jgi:hypothetical protein
MKKAMLLLLLTVFLISCVKPIAEPLPHGGQDRLTLDDIDTLYVEWEEPIVSIMSTRESISWLRV